MNRLFDFLRVRIAQKLDATDRNLLDHFLANRDESAFAELVRRYAPLVWGVCRRRLTDHDAEDTFQATFLVLLRRAARLSADVPLGPWLHRVAVMTVRNMARGNRRRAFASGPLERDLAAHEPHSSDTRIDLDAALLELSERDRIAIVLCHLQGLSRREAALQLGCREGTLSARLSRALERLRSRLGDATAILATAGSLALPSELSASMVRVGMIYTASNLTAAGVSPSVVGITEGVLRMFWMKKFMSAVAIAVLVTGGLCIGLTRNSDHLAQANDPVLADPQVKSGPKALPTDPEAAKRVLEERLKELSKKAAEIEKDIKVAQSEKEKLEEVQREKIHAAELEGYLEIVCHVSGGAREPRFTVSEVIGGKVREVTCNDIDMLSTYVTRTFNDPKGPKKLSVRENAWYSQDQSKAVLAVCAQAGFTKATLHQSVPSPIHLNQSGTTLNSLNSTALNSTVFATEKKTTEIDLTKLNKK